MKPLIADEYLDSRGTVDVIALREDLFDYFNTLHYMLSDTEFDQIAHFARDWIEEHLVDSERIDKSIRHKAHEMSSGDHFNDYYQALLIRRDQLLAARDVFREYTRNLRDIFTENRENVLESLQKFDFDQGIYLRAIEYHAARNELSNSYNEMLSDELLEVESLIENAEQSLELEGADHQKSDLPERRSKASKNSSDIASKKKSSRFFHRNI